MLWLTTGILCDSVSVLYTMLAVGTKPLNTVVEYSDFGFEKCKVQCWLKYLDNLHFEPNLWVFFVVCYFMLYCMHLALFCLFAESYISYSYNCVR